METHDIVPIIADIAINLVLIHGGVGVLFGLGFGLFLLFWGFF